ncbi:MAG: acyl transferase, partial [Bacteroidota bacterium]
MFEDRVFSISSGTQFEELAIELFHYQYENVPVYRDFCDHLRVNPASVTTLEAIPFLPIEFFKSFSVISSEKTAAVQFASSGTTGSQRSYHHVASTELYQESFRAGFQRAYGNVRDYVILALLPSYQEQGASSLIYMVDQLIKDTGNLRSG